jgi:hypothetical protein
MLLKLEDDLNSLFVFDDLGVASSEITGILVKRPVAARHVDHRQGQLVWHVVTACSQASDSLLLYPEMSLIEDDHVD